MDIKLAEALLRRKELSAKVEQLQRIKDNDLFYQLRSKRISVTEGIDNLDADFPKLNVSQVTAEYDFYARQLRLIDGHIQHLNWVTSVPENAHECFNTYSEK